MLSSFVHKYKVLSVLANPVFLVAAITFGGALLRLYNIGSRSLWLDEAIMYWASRGSFAEVIAQNAAQQSSPPLFAVLTNLVTWMGDSEVSLRVPSWLAGIAAIPALYIFARQFLSRPGAAFCAGIAAFSVTLVEYSQQAREYSVTFLIAILMLTFFNRFARKPGWGNIFGVTVTCVIGVWTQYGLGLLVLALNIVMAVELIRRKDRRALLTGWAISQVLVLVTVLVVYQIALKPQLAAWPSGPGTGAVSNHLAPGYWEGSLGSLVKLAVSNTHDLFYFAYPNTYLVLLVFSVGLLAMLLRPGNRLGLAMLLIPMLVTFLAACARMYPYGGLRQDIFLLPMIYLVAGFGLDYIWQADARRITALAFVVILGLGGIMPLVTYFQSDSENMKPVAAALQSSYAVGDQIYVYYGANPAFRYYYRSNITQTTYGVESRAQPEDYFRQLESIPTGNGRVWLVFSHCYNDECERIPQWANQLGLVARVVSSNDVALYRIDRK